MANNSSGARSVLYGKTIDHVIEQQVVLSDGIGRAVPRPVRAKRTASAVPASRSRPSATEPSARSRASAPTKSNDDSPKSCAGSAATTSTSSSTVDKPSICQADGRLRRHARHRARSQARLVPLPKAKAVLAISSTELLEALGATPHPPHTTLRRRSDGRLHPRPHPRTPTLDRHAPQSFITASPAHCSASSSTTIAPRSAATTRSPRARPRRRGFGYHSTVHELAAQARIWSLREAALGLSMAMKDDAKSLSFVEDTAVAPEKLRDYIERFLDMLSRTTPSPASTRTHPSDACTCGPSST